VSLNGHELKAHQSSQKGYHRSLHKSKLQENVSKRYQISETKKFWNDHDIYTKAYFNHWYGYFKQCQQCRNELSDNSSACRTFFQAMAPV
jgi:hypothetical protein